MWEQDNTPNKFLGSYGNHDRISWFYELWRRVDWATHTVLDERSVSSFRIKERKNWRQYFSPIYWYLFSKNYGITYAYHLAKHHQKITRIINFLKFLLFCS
jgi:hypothetical protein